MLRTLHVIANLVLLKHTCWQYTLANVIWEPISQIILDFMKNMGKNMFATPLAHMSILGFNASGQPYLYFGGGINDRLHEIILC